MSHTPAGHGHAVDQQLAIDVHPVGTRFDVENHRVGLFELLQREACSAGEVAHEFKTDQGRIVRREELRRHGAPLRQQRRRAWRLGATGA